MLKAIVICLAMTLCACEGTIHDLVDGCSGKEIVAENNGYERGRAEVIEQLNKMKNETLFYGVRVKIVNHFYKGQKGTIVDMRYDGYYDVLLDMNRDSGVNRGFNAGNLEVIR